MLLSSSSRSLPDEWMTLAYSTWVVGHVVVGVVLELLGEDQEAVQRGAKLVRHVGDELGLVLRRDGELAGLLLDEALGLLDLLVLLLRLDVLLGEQPGLPSEVLVGLAQLLLLRAELLGQRLGLLEQVLGEGVGLDRAEDEADALGERSRNAWWVTLNGENEASSTTARTDPSNRTGRTMMLSGADSPRPELILT